MIHIAAVARVAPLRRPPVAHALQNNLAPHHQPLGLDPVAPRRRHRAPLVARRVIRAELREKRRAAGRHRRVIGRQRARGSQRHCQNVIAVHRNAGKAREVKVAVKGLHAELRRAHVERRDEIARRQRRAVGEASRLIDVKIHRAAIGRHRPAIRRPGNQMPRRGMQAHQRNIEVIADVAARRVVAVGAEGAQRRRERALNRQTHHPTLASLRAAELRFPRAVLPDERLRQLPLGIKDQIIAHLAPLLQLAQLLAQLPGLHRRVPPLRLRRRAEQRLKLHHRQLHPALLGSPAQKIRRSGIPALHEAAKARRHPPSQSVIGHAVLLRKAALHRILRRRLPRHPLGAGLPVAGRQQQAERQQTQQQAQSPPWMQPQPLPPQPPLRRTLVPARRPPPGHAAAGRQRRCTALNRAAPPVTNRHHRSSIHHS